MLYFRKLVRYFDKHIFKVWTKILRNLTRTIRQTKQGKTRKHMGYEFTKKQNTHAHENNNLENSILKLNNKIKRQCPK